MAVKNARNFVRDVNTRKICYSFCHLEMVEPLYYMQYYPVHRERSQQAKLEDRAFFLHKIKANFFFQRNGHVQKDRHLCMYASKDCSSDFRSKHSTVLVLCLLRNLLEQSLLTYLLSFQQSFKEIMKCPSSIYSSTDYGHPMKA